MVTILERFINVKPPLHRPKILFSSKPWPCGQRTGDSFFFHKGLDTGHSKLAKTISLFVCLFCKDEKIVSLKKKWRNRVFFSAPLCLSLLQLLYGIFRFQQPYTCTSLRSEENLMSTALKCSSLTRKMIPTVWRDFFSSLIISYDFKYFF